MGQAAYQFDTVALARFLFLLTAVLVARALFSALSALFLGRFAGTAGYNFRVNFAKFFLRQPFAKIEATNSGENLSVFTNDLPRAVNFVSSRYGLLGIIEDSILLIAAVVYMLHMNWLYTLVYLAFFPVLALIQFAISMPLGKSSKRVLEASAEFNAVVNDSLQNTATVIAYSLEDELESLYLSAYKKYNVEARRNVFLICTLVIGGFVTSAFPLVYIFIVSGFAVVNETKLISDFIVFTGLGMFAAGWLMSLASAMENIQTDGAGAERLNTLISGKEEYLSKSEKLPASGVVAVSFQEVSFAYGEEAQNVLQSASFEIQHGAKVAIVGGSGSGKSTILKLLLGLYEPKEGKINVFGTDTANVSKYALRDVFAYVPQDSFLFPVSIRENITSKSKISPEDTDKLNKVCRDAGILDFINSLPNGFDSVLSESAENISGGQRQRIAMARAFYKDAPIILFDEATSALDPTTEAAILESLATATKDKTVIMVAHRTSAKAFCETVITLEGGRVV